MTICYIFKRITPTRNKLKKAEKKKCKEKQILPPPVLRKFTTVREEKMLIYTLEKLLAYVILKLIIRYIGNKLKNQSNAVSIQQICNLDAFFDKTRGENLLGNYILRGLNAELLPHMFSN